MGISDWTPGHPTGGSDSWVTLETALVGALGHHRFGGLDGLVDRFVLHGLGEVINSWISTEENLPLSVEQLRQVFGNDLIAEIAHQASVSEQQAAWHMAVLLPRVVDKLTPRGRIPPGSGRFGSLMFPEDQ
jgi:uncharacterized protein YidB (DUF937 family)